MHNSIVCNSAENIIFKCTQGDQSVQLILPATDISYALLHKLLLPQFEIPYLVIDINPKETKILPFPKRRYMQ